MFKRVEDWLKHTPLGSLQNGLLGLGFRVYKMVFLVPISEINLFTLKVDWVVSFQKKEKEGKVCIRPWRF